MPQKDRNDIRKALLKKGFYQEESDHEYFYCIWNQSIFTKLSHGSNYKTYGDALLAQMKKQLHLSKEQLLNFIDCPLTVEEYYEVLNNQKMIPPNK